MIDKIILSNCKTKCTVHLVNGPSLHFDFSKLRMNYLDGLVWVQTEVFGGTSTGIRKVA